MTLHPDTVKPQGSLWSVTQSVPPPGTKTGLQLPECTGLKGSGVLTLDCQTVAYPSTN